MHIYFALIILVSFVPRVYTTSRIFTCGFVDSAEYDVMNSVVNNASSLSLNVSVVLKKFNITEKKNLINQASAFRDQNVVALIEGSHTKTSACALSTVTGIPLIRLHGDSRPFDQCEKAIQISAGYKDYAHATLDILNTFGWKNIIVVFEERHIHEAGNFYVISRSSEMTVHLVQLPKQGENEDPKAPILKALEQIKHFEAEIILLYMENENVELMLQQKHCQHRIIYKWVLQGQMPLKLSCNQNVVISLDIPHTHNSDSDELKIAVGNNYNNTNKEQLALAYDAVQVINQAVNKEPCSSINGSVISPEDTEAMLTCIRKVNLNGLTGPIHFNEYGKRQGIELEILNLRNNSFTKIGTWNSTKGAVLFGNFLRNMDNPHSKASLEGRKLRAVVLLVAPFVMKKKHEDGSVSYEGYGIDMLKELARNLKFTYDIYPSPDGLYGAETGNGTWNGMIGEIVNERADIIVAPITVTESREKVVDFSVPYMYYTEEMLLKKASSKKNLDLLQFMNPFDNHVWFATLATLVIISVAVFVINYFSPYGHKDDNGRGTSEEFSFFNSVWFALACMLQQGGDNTPRSLSGRILAGCYWFCILIWVSTYTANLAAFFTIKNTEHPIRNLEDVVKSSYQVAILASSSTSDFFMSNQFETYKKIWQRIQAGGTQAKDVQEGIQWVRERDDFVFITDGPFIRHGANQPPCDLTVVPGLATDKGFGLALQANDPHTNDFTLAILRLHENDFLASLKRKWWETTNKCPEEEATTLSRKRIDLMSMLGVYIVMSVGMVIAFLTLIAEIFWKRRAKQMSMNKIQRTKLRSVEVHPGIDKQTQQEYQ